MSRDHSAAAQLIALGVLAIITGLGLLSRRVNVATETVTYGADGVQQTLHTGAIIPAAADLNGAGVAGKYKSVRLPFLRLLVVGYDNRVSTSKFVVAAWTYAVVFGLLALIVAKWLGSATGYQALINHGLRDEYLLFLGGPFAAAVLAKYQAQGSADKTAGGVGTATAKQLLTNDRGDVDLGDFQYVLFNALALVYYLGTFIPHLQSGMPALPSLLTGLALTSAGGYTAKKFVGQAAPTLSSVLPTTAARAAPVEVWGFNLIVPASVAPDHIPLPPHVTIGGATATVTANEQTLGADHFTVAVPAAALPGQVKLVAVRADGVRATGPGGTDSLPLTVTVPGV